MKIRYLLYAACTYLLIGCGGGTSVTSSNSAETPEEPTNGFIDSDGDGFPDHVDKFPNDPNEFLDHDQDGIGNNADLDDDGDGIPDVEDLFPLQDNSEIEVANDDTTTSKDDDQVNASDVPKDESKDASDTKPNSDPKDEDNKDSANDKPKEDVKDNKDETDSMVNLDTDGDGVPNTMDRFPSDKSKLSEQGFTWERWNTVYGSHDEAIENGLFETQADDAQFITGSLSTQQRLDDRYTQRVRGYVYSDKKQTVEFFMAGDDHFRLYFSPSIYPKDKQQIIDSTSWVEPENFTKYPEQKSSAIQLEAGQFYYLEGVVTEFTGNDHLSIAWKRDGGDIEILTDIQQFRFPDEFDESNLNNMDVPNSNEPNKTTGSDSRESNTDSKKESDNETPSSDENANLESLILEVNEKVLQDKCVACHKPEGFAKNSHLLFASGLSSEVAMGNTLQVSMLMKTLGAEYVLAKVRGENHKGGKQYGTTTEEYKLLEVFSVAINQSTDSSDQNTENSIEGDVESDVPSNVESSKEVTNIALNQPASLSSTGHGGTASKAVDGDLSGSNWAHSNRSSTNDQREWWHVDLEEKMYIDHIVIHPRPNFNRRIEGGSIAISKEEIKDKSLSELKSEASALVIEIPSIGSETKIEAKTLGQFVKVFGPTGEPLNFTEIEVMGHIWEEVEREQPEIQYSQLGERCDASQSLEPMVRRLTRPELVATVNHAFPQLDGAWNPETLTNDLTTEIGFDNDLELVNGSITFVDQWSRTSEKLVDTLLEDHSQETVPCLGQGESCVSQVLPVLFEKLARKPLSSDDETELFDYWNNVNDVMDESAAWKWTLTALLQNPSVIYRTEVGERAGGVFQLSGREIADALAYTYTSQPADATLIALADNGDLLDPVVRIEQAKRLLQTEAGEETVLRFFKIWLKLDKVKENAKTEVANFSVLAEQMTEEALMLVKKVIIDENGSVGDLLTSQTTFINQSLADHYGWNVNVGNEWQEVPRETGLGYLNTGAFLVGNSLPQMSSPTQRGMLIYRRMLCNDVPPAPPEIPSIDVEVADNLTTREKWIQAHTGDPACQACHENFDPLGFALENFDDLGRFRDTEQGKFIDVTGVIPGDFEVAIDGYEQLAHGLAEDERLASCVSGFMNHWVFAGAKGKTCLAEGPRDQLASGELTFLEYFAAIAGEDNFVQRVAE